MKIIFIISLFIALSDIESIAQNGSNQKSPTTKSTPDSTANKLRIRVYNQKTEAYYPQGDLELFTMIAKELQYSDADRAKKVNGHVLIRFDVDADSTIKDIRVIKDVCVDCSKNLIKIFDKLKFVPATTLNGKQVRSNIMMEIPVWAH